MANKVASFENPPVIETVLGVQFTPVEGMGNHHLGAFWAALDHSVWPHVDEISARDQVVENFDASPVRIPSFQVFESVPPLRIRVRSELKDRMLQVQNGWFVYNWLAGPEGHEYPRYDRICPEFSRYWEFLRERLGTYGLPNPKPNLWEVTYVNHIPCGTCWNQPDDWPSVLPGLFQEMSELGFGRLNGLNSTTRFDIEAGRAHLYIDVNSAVQTTDDPKELLVVKLTARGPIVDHTETELTEGLNLGHRTIVAAFDAITSGSAQRCWGRIHDADND